MGTLMRFMFEDTSQTGTRALHRRPRQLLRSSTESPPPTMSSSSSSSSGIGLPGLLTVLFIGLKLTGHITWPWLWVLSPLWISLLLFLILLAIAALFVILSK
jgi:hypothetical protein